MVNKDEISELSASVDALIKKYGKLSGSASADAKAKLLAKAHELREALEKATKDLPPTVGRGVEATKDAATAAKGAFVADVVPVAIAALSTALDLIAEKSIQAKASLAETVELKPAPEPTPEPEPTPKKKSRAWVGILIAPIVAVVAATVAFTVLGPRDDDWVPVEDEDISENPSEN